MSAPPLPWLAAAILLTCCGRAAAVEPPRMLDAGWQIEPVLADATLVTPTGCCIDDQGDLLVIECHTHFRPDDYEGPEFDRIYRLKDADGDGQLDAPTLFYEGGTATMNLASLGQGWIAVASRGELCRVRDSDGDGIADQKETMLLHKTPADYPHNGLGGLTVSADGWVYVGQGENLGHPYEIVGVDGIRQVGGGEGGNVFRCRVDGTRLQRVATGFWNPFGICTDSAQRLWAVGNDPDAMPPNRLVHVVAAGDYGFQFRFGRAGTHALQAWDGDLPGTLPMAAAAGEAACAVTPVDGRLWVTSWGDNRIEAFTLHPEGATCRAEVEIIAQGDENFRPVGMAVAPDGSVYVTDWVDRSYQLHGKGRLWRLRRSGTTTSAPTAIPHPSSAESETRRLERGEEVTVAQRLAAMDDEDPFRRQAALSGLVSFGQLDDIRGEQLTSSRQGVGLLTGWRWRQLVSPDSVDAETQQHWIAWGLASEFPDVVLAATRWASERGSVDAIPTIQRTLDRADVTPRLFAATIAALAYLESGSAASGKRDPAVESRLNDVAANNDLPAKLRALALQRIPPEATEPKVDQLQQWAEQTRDRDLLMATVRLLDARDKEDADALLASIAGDEALDAQSRADALAALTKNAGRHAVLINKLSTPRQPEPLRIEAKRIRNRTWAASRDENRPGVDDVDRWTELVGQGGDVDAGRRVFFRTTCANCHRHSGRGATTGPDLTSLSGQMTPRRLIDSILHPSKEVGPLYVPWKIVTVDGRVLTGLKLDASNGDKLRFQGADGGTFEVDPKEIEIREPVGQSIMPAGLVDALTLDELRDLVAFLTEP